MIQLKKRESTGNSVVNMEHWFNFATFDVIGDLAFGETLSILKEGVWSRYLSTMFGSVQQFVVQRAVRRMFPSTFRFWVKLFTPKEILDDQMFQYNLAKDKLARRLAQDTERPDFGKIRGLDYLRQESL